MDTQNTDVVRDMLKDRRATLIERGDLIDASSIGHKCGLKAKLAVTPNFFNHFYPYAEDATKGVSFEEIMYDIIKIFKKEAGVNISNGFKFPVVSKTYVKVALGPEEVVTFADGKPRDKYVTVNVNFMGDENLQPSIVFGIDDFKFLGGENS